MSNNFLNRRGDPWGQRTFSRFNQTKAVIRTLINQLDSRKIFQTIEFIDAPLTRIITYQVQITRNYFISVFFSGTIRSKRQCKHLILFFSRDISLYRNAW